MPVQPNKPAGVRTSTPAQAARRLEALIAAKRPACLWGMPGIGKSQVVQQTAAKLGIECRDVRAVLLDPVDLRGLPHVNGDGRAHWAIPEFLPQGGSGVLFLDELNRAPTLVQNACLQLVLDRRLGEYQLPDGWAIVAACNRETDGGGVTRMSAALASRFVRINVAPDLLAFRKWAVDAGVDVRVIAYLGWRPQHLAAFDPSAEASPTPRGWEYVSDVLKLNLPDRDDEMALVEGIIGHATTSDLYTYFPLMKVTPNVDAILLNPATARVPSEPSELYATAAALSLRIDDRNIDRAITWLDRCPQELAVFAVLSATKRDESLQGTPAFVTWGVQHQEVL